MTYLKQDNLKEKLKLIIKRGKDNDWSEAIIIREIKKELGEKLVPINLRNQILRNTNKIHDQFWVKMVIGRKDIIYNKLRLDTFEYIISNFDIWFAYNYFSAPYLLDSLWKKHQEKLVLRISFSVPNEK